MVKKIVVALMVIVVAVSLFAVAQDTPQEGTSPSPGASRTEFTSAPDIVKAMVEKADGIKDYSLDLFYSGKEGTYTFEYRCVRPCNIRTRIVEGPNARAILLYLPDEKADQIKAKKGIFKKWISVDKYKDTPLVQSLLDYFLREIQAYPEGKLIGRDKVTLTLGKTVTVTSENNTVASGGVLAPAPTESSSPEMFESPAPSPTPETSASPAPTDASPSPTASESPEQGNEVKSGEKIVKDCYIVEFSKDTIKDIVAIDTDSLWVVFRKKLVDGKVDQEAAVWHIEENSRPEIKF